MAGICELVLSWPEPPEGETAPVEFSAGRSAGAVSTGSHLVRQEYDNSTPETPCLSDETEQPGLAKTPGGSSQDKSASGEDASI
jgi:hypothetical protein